MARGLPLVVLSFLSVGVGLGTGCFVLDRADQLPPGSVQGTVVDSSGEPVNNARVTLVSLGRTVTTDDAGRFIARDVPAGAFGLTALVDRDDDGVDDEGALTAVELKQDDGRIRGLDIGRVTLQPTGSLAGRLVDDSGGASGGATVAVWHTVDLTLGARTVAVDLPAEQIVETNADGTFLIRGLIPGRLYFVGFDSVANQPTRGAQERVVEIPVGDTIDSGDTTLFPLEGTVRVILALAAAFDDTIEVRIFPPGQAPPAAPTSLIPAGEDSPNLDVPAGIWNLRLKSGIFTAGQNGLVAPPSDEPISWGIFELLEGDDVCGDGLTTGDEQCDDGADNSDTTADACRTSCALPICGDAVTDPGLGEGCDDADANSDTAPDACRTSCQPASCGDDVVDPGNNEVCDDGEDNSDTTPDACRTSCQPASCGDAVVDPGNDEACDDGDGNSDTAPDACRTTCQPASCGDGVTDILAGEACDDGENNTDSCTPQGDQACTFCRVGTCEAVTIPATAEVIVDVRSSQAWARNLLEGVTVSLAGTTVASGVDGFARIPVTLPLDADARIVVGGHRDALISDRSFTPTFVAPPAGLVHEDSVIVPVEVYEGCAVDRTATGQDNFLNANVDCPFLLVDLSLEVPPSAFTIDNGVDYTLRLAALPNFPFDNPLVGLGFPETKTADGTLLTCDQTIAFFVDGADVVTDPLQAPRTAGLGRSDSGVSAFRFDESQGGYVAVPEANLTDEVAFVQQGLWCLGREVTETTCLNISIDDIEVPAPTETVIVDVAAESYTRVRTRIAPGTSACVEFPTGPSALVSAVTSDGRTAEGFSSGQGGPIGTCTDGTQCEDITLFFSSEPSFSCLTVQAQVFDNFSDVTPSPPTTAVSIREAFELTYYRGRLLFADDRQRHCIQVPNFTNRLRFRLDDPFPDCNQTFGFQTEVFNDLQTPLTGPPTCAEDTSGTDCDNDLGIADFFCNS